MKVKYIVSILFSFAIVFLFTGCATFLSGSYYSKVDPDYEIKRNDSILVTINQGDIDSKYYVKFVIKKLKDNGFTDVYSYKDKNLPIINSMIFISVNEKFDSYQYSSANYGMVDSGTSSTDCYGYGNRLSCSTTKNKQFGIIGYSQKTKHIHGHYFSMNWYNVNDGQRIFFAMGSTYEKKCNSDELYRFLINETINRINFDRPMDYKFKVKIHKDNFCK